MVSARRGGVDDTQRGHQLQHCIPLAQALAASPAPPAGGVRRRGDSVAVGVPAGALRSRPFGVPGTPTMLGKC
eukprot:2606480-Lingulodinium_polyedra.AAC.1